MEPEELPLEARASKPGIPTSMAFFLACWIGLGTAVLFLVFVAPWVGPEKVDSVFDFSEDLNGIWRDLNNEKPLCGNHLCEAGETVQTCFIDCFVCNNNDACEPPLGENQNSCPHDCGPVSVCNVNGSCEAGETAANCPADCVSTFNPSCGDHVCNGTETCSSCPEDCGSCPVCGDGVCEGTENCSSCPSDCGSCPACNSDGTCEAGENYQNCPDDCEQPMCTNGQTKPCSNANSYGSCTGTQACSNNSWEACSAATPAPENCSDQIDNDCDGTINEQCVPGLQTDSDADGLPDQWETFYFNSLDQSASGDPDSDGATNAQEFAFRTNPIIADTDTDGLNDGREIQLQTNPHNPDTDGDGLSDQEEADVRHTDPLAKTAWSFTYTNSEGTHTRTQNGIQMSDSISGKLGFMPWGYQLHMESIYKDYMPRLHPQKEFDVTKQAIEYWADAGATAIGIVMQDDEIKDQSPEPGYQNQYVQAFKQLADQKGIRLVMGYQLGMDFYDFNKPVDPQNPDLSNKFYRAGQVMDQVMQFTGVNEVLYEEEYPIRVHLLPRVLDGSFVLDDYNLGLIRANYALLYRPGVQYHFWLPAYWVDGSGNPYTNPPVKTGNRDYDDNEYYKYVQNKIFGVLQGLMGNDFHPIMYVHQTCYAENAPRTLTKTYAQSPFTQSVMQAMEGIQSHNFQPFLNNYRPWPFNYSYASWGGYNYYYSGPAETVFDLSYMFGRDLSTANFPNLKINSISVYPQDYIDLVGLAQREYVVNGIHIAFSPNNPHTETLQVRRGGYFSMIVSAYGNYPNPPQFSAQIENFSAGSDTYSLEVLPNGKQAVFSWIPGQNRSGYYLVTLTVTDGAGMNSTQTIPLLVTS